jgi:6-pyruvoyltetrahydropterin/6-carboxytetrahydropterin synthase
VEIYKEFTFEAAHRLPNVPTDHKCYRLHGHSYRVQIWVRGEVDPKLGWVMDFSTIKEAFEPLRLKLDHYYLNEIAGLEIPTSEVLAKWIWDRLSLPGLTKVLVSETCTSAAVYSANPST